MSQPESQIEPVFAEPCEAQAFAIAVNRKEAWAEAYRCTPHGKLIELAADGSWNH